MNVPCFLSNPELRFLCRARGELHGSSADFMYMALSFCVLHAKRIPTFRESAAQAL